VLTNDVQAMLTEVRFAGQERRRPGEDRGKRRIVGPVAGGGSVPAFRRDELAVIVDEAHRLGKRVTAHARSGTAIVDCIDAGVDWLQHGDYMTKEQVRKARRQRRAALPDPDAQLQHRRVGPSRRLFAGPHRSPQARRRGGRRGAELRRRQGVRMMCGTDTGFAVTPYGEWHAREMELFVSHLGMSPLEAISCGNQGGGLRGRPRRHRRAGARSLGRRAGGGRRSAWPTSASSRQEEDRALFKGGEAVDLAEPPPVMRWPWEKSLEIFATGSFATTPSTAGRRRSEEKEPLAWASLEARGPRDYFSKIASSNIATAPGPACRCSAISWRAASQSREALRFM